MLTISRNLNTQECDIAFLFNWKCLHHEHFTPWMANKCVLCIHFVDYLCNMMETILIYTHSQCENTTDFSCTYVFCTCFTPNIEDVETLKLINACLFSLERVLKLYLQTLTCFQVILNEWKNSKSDDLKVLKLAIVLSKSLAMRSIICLIQYGIVRLVVTMVSIGIEQQRHSMI